MTSSNFVEALHAGHNEQAWASRNPAGGRDAELLRHGTVCITFCEVLRLSRMGAWMNPLIIMVLVLAWGMLPLYGQKQIAVAEHLWQKDAFYRGTVGSDGLLYFFRKVAPGQEDYRIYTARPLPEGQWSEASPLELGGNYSDLYPTLSPDGKVLAFVSYRPVPGRGGAEKPNGHIWYAVREGDSWGAPRYAESLNEFGHYHSGLLFDADSPVLRFRRTTPDWAGSSARRAHWDGERWRSVEPDAEAAAWMGDRDGLYYWGHLPSPDGSFVLVFASRYGEGSRRRGPARAFVARRGPHGFGKLVPVAEDINRQVPNFWSFLPGGNELLFTLNYSSLHRISVADLLAGAGK